MFIDDEERLKHMLDASQKAYAFCKNKRREDLENDEMFLFALIYAIEIIGEAANNITPKFKSEHDTIEWRDIISMRNRLVHGYFNIDKNILWDTVMIYLPSLIEKLQKLV